MSKQCHEVDYTILGHDMQLVDVNANGDHVMKTGSKGDSS